MVTHPPVPAGEHVPSADQRVVLCVPWTHYETELAVRGESHHPRLAYLDRLTALQAVRAFREALQK
jgi:hypothetical protein